MIENVQQVIRWKSEVGNGWHFDTLVTLPEEHGQHGDNKNNVEGSENNT